MSQKELDRITDKVLAHNPNPPKVLEVVAGAPDKPLVVGDIQIACYVLENGVRVLSQRGVFSSLGATRGGRSHRTAALGGGAEIPRFLAAKELKPFINNELAAALKQPMLFQPAHGGSPAYGYSATILPDLCTVFMEAHAAGATTTRQQRMVTCARVLLQAFAKVGIIALVDEATGYQRIREERALAQILEQFIAKELQPWTRTFPMEFYEEICRLRGWSSILAVKRPSVVGKITNDVVYSRLPEGVLEELQRINPSSEGKRKYRHHQLLSPEVGHPKLKEHLAAVMALMRISNTWPAFKRKLQISFPKRGETTPLILEP